MKSDRWRRIEELYHSAVERDPESRLEFLERACEGDSGLRREVLSLLANDGRASSFLESPALEIIRGGSGESFDPRGMTISHYRVIEELGSGGMGVVYRATDIRLGRDVALKFLPQRSASDPEALQRFQREARAASALNHPNICTIHDIDEYEGRPFIVMELLEGTTLEQRIDRKPMPERELLEIARQIASALEAAHAKGIVHRDIKPANLFMTTLEQVKVLDFGVAKLVAHERDLDAVEPTDVTLPIQQKHDVLTAPGVALGTLPYMAPEQWRGERTDARTDIYSLGVVMFEMATGQLPFASKGARALRETVLHQHAEHPAKRNRQISAKLDAVIVRCLAKDPAERYQSCAALLAALRQVAHAGITTTRRTVFAAGALAVAIALGLFIRSALTQHTDVDSLAVLPFVNATRDPAIEYLSDGISDTLTNNLSQLPKLRVMARTTTYHYKGQTIDPKRVGRELGVTAILTGDVAARGDSLDIRAELVRTADGSQIWGSHYDGQSADAASFQHRIAADVVRVIRGRLEGRSQSAKISKRGTEDPEAYQLYLKAQYARNRMTRQSILTAAQLFRQAIDRDPNFALAYVGLADSYLNIETYLGSSAMEYLPKARSAAMKALQIDDTIGEAYASLAMIEFNYWEWEEAEKNFKRSIELNPNYAQARDWYATYLTTVSRLPEALEQIKIAQRLDPLSPVINSNAAANKLRNGQFDEGIADLERIVRAEPNMPVAYEWLTFGYMRKKEYDKAIAAAQKQIETSGNTTLALANAAFVYHTAGRVKEARAAAEEIISRAVFTPPLEMAAAYISIGDHDKAFQWLERGFIDHTGTMTYITWPPWFDEIYRDPRYVSLLKRMELKRYNAS